MSYQFVGTEPAVYQCRLITTLSGKPIPQNARGPWTNCTQEEYEAQAVNVCRGTAVILARRYEFRILGEIKPTAEQTEGEVRPPSKVIPPDYFRCETGA